MPRNEYRFVTHWRVDGDVTEAADILSDPAITTRWWPAVYLDVRVVEPGDERRVGCVVDLHTKGWLPYTLRWRFRVTESWYPHGFSLQAWGDFEGGGVWHLAQEGTEVAITYEWHVRAGKRLLRFLSPLLRPIFEANHRWAMATGERSLQLELWRRRARTPEAWAPIPPPPGPTWPVRRPRRPEDAVSTIAPRATPPCSGRALGQRAAINWRCWSRRWISTAIQRPNPTRWRQRWRT
jgi:hypothetical protein